jgi:hypothetical protein
MLLLPACQSTTDAVDQKQELADPPPTDLQFDAEKLSAECPEATAAVSAEGTGFYSVHGAGPRALRPEEQDNCVWKTPSRLDATGFREIEC